MKRNLLSRTLLLLLMVVGGVCGAWAQTTDEADWSYTIVDGDKSKLNTTEKTFAVDETHVWSYSDSEVGQGEPAVAVQKSNEIFALKFGSSKSIFYNPVVLSTNAFASVNVTKVSLYLKHNGKKVGNLSVKQGNITIGTATTEETSDWIDVVSSETTSGNGGTLTITYSVEQALYINKIEVWYEESGKTTTTVSIINTGITNTDVHTSTDAGSLTASVAAGENILTDAKVTWSSSDEEVATIDKDGKVTLVAEGKTMITASYAGNDAFSASSATYELTVDDSRSAAGLAFLEDTQEVEVGSTLTSPSLTNPNNLIVTYSSGDEAIATVDADGNVTGVAAGSTTITATFAGDNTYKGASVSYTIIVKKPMPKGALFWESVSNYVKEEDGGAIGVTSEYLDSEDWQSFTHAYPGRTGGFKLGSKNNTAKLVTKELNLVGDGILTFKVQRYDSSNEGELTVAVTNATATGDLSVKGTADWVEKTVYLKGGNGSVVITFETTSDNKRIRLDDILLMPAVSVDMSTKEYISFCSDKALDFTNVEGLEVLVVTKINDTSVSTEAVTTVPAGEGVILHRTGTATSFNVPVAATATAHAANKLVGVLEATTIGENGTDYVLKDGKFKKANPGTLAAGKAYLKTDANAAPALTIGFGDEGTTGIRSIENGQLTIDNVYYDLSGRRVAEPTKGVYIVNGKKVVIK